MERIRITGLHVALAGIDRQMIENPTTEQLSSAYEALDEFVDNAGMSTRKFAEFVCRYFGARGSKITFSTPQVAAMKNTPSTSFSTIMNTIGGSLPTIPAPVAKIISRSAYPAGLAPRIEPIPEYRLDALANDVQRMQCDARANSDIPSIFRKYQCILTPEDQASLSGEQAKLRALLSAFGWWLDGWTDATRTELR